MEENVYFHSHKCLQLVARGMQAQKHTSFSCSFLRIAYVANCVLLQRSKAKSSDPGCPWCVHLQARLSPTQRTIWQDGGPRRCMNIHVNDSFMAMRADGRGSCSTHQCRRSPIPRPYAKITAPRNSSPEPHSHREDGSNVSPISKLGI